MPAVSQSALVMSTLALFALVVCSCVGAAMHMAKLATTPLFLEALQSQLGVMTISQESRSLAVSDIYQLERITLVLFFLVTDCFAGAGTRTDNVESAPM
jgi:hypothetical protein